MNGSRFEELLDKEMAVCGAQLLANPIGNPEKDILLKGKHAGLVRAKEIYREATKTEDDDGDNL